MLDDSLGVAAFIAFKEEPTAFVYTLCAFDGSRLGQLFLFSYLRRARATGPGFLLLHQRRH